MGAYGRQIIDLVPQLQSGKLAPAKSTLPVARATRQRRTAYITEITIENFKSIRRLELSFKTDQPGTAPIPESLSLPPPSAVETSTPPKALASPTPTRPAWKVLLGENGTGKSSVLQATALALAGAHSLRNLKITSWEKILRRPRGNRAGPKAGFVRVGLSTGDDVELRFNAKTAWFTSGPAGAQTLLRGYGPTRNLPTTRPPAGWKKVEAMVRIGNLFDSNDPMCSAERWLVNLEPARFNTAALALKDLLGLQQGDRIRCVRRKPSLIDSRKKQICVDFGPTTVGFDELSDGYQSMIALAVDIMAGLPKTSADFQSDTGIVLLDELGTHLHPRWRMRVVRSLQNAFPRLQFFASTHEPLCIRGLRRSEVSVLERIGQHVIKIADEDLPDPEPMRIDQLLTSRYFGLESTIDPEMDRKFQEYYRLLGQVSLTPAEQSRLALLEAEINRQPRALGFTRRDQLVYEIIDEYLARDLRLQGPEERTRLRESTKQKVAEIFHQVMLLAEPLQ
ncbi:MAG: AAA family ATPase [Verrucomicrobiota bacterium]